MSEDSKKAVRFNYFGLQYPNKTKDDYEEDLLDKISIDKDVYKRAISGDYIIKLNNDLFKPNDYNNLFLGEIIKAKQNELPFKYDYEEGKKENLGFDKNEGLGTPTHFLFDKNLNILMLQAGGVGIKQWKKFYEINYGVQIETPYVIDPKSFNNVFNMNYLKRINIKVKKTKSIGEDQPEPEVDSLFNIKEIAKNTDTDMFRFELSSKEGLSLGPVKQIVQQYSKLNEEYKESIIVEGKDENKETTDVFDLVTNRYYDKIEIPSKKNLSEISTTDIFNSMIDKYVSIENDLNTIYKWKEEY